MYRRYLYRIYPTRQQTEALAAQLEEARVLYNAALQERRDAYRKTGRSIHMYEQFASLKTMRADGSLSLPNHQTAQDVLRRLDKAFVAFFRRIKTGETPGYPRFKNRARYQSFTFPTYGNGCKLLNTGRLRLQGVGCVKIKLHRPLTGTIKTVTIKQDTGRWYVTFSVECSPSPLPPSESAIGIDVGIEAFATLSDGTRIPNPRLLKNSLARLRCAARKVARRKRGGRRRRKAVHLLQRIHTKIRNQRKDFHHKTARSLVAQYGRIFFEDLNIKGLARSFLAQSIHDVGWAAFLRILIDKAESANREVEGQVAAGTSQRCPCGVPVRKTLNERWHYCEACGLSVCRDHASALEVLRLGLGCSLQDITGAVRLSVS